MEYKSKFKAEKIDKYLSIIYTQEKLRAFYEKKMNGEEPLTKDDVDEIVSLLNENGSQLISFNGMMVVGTVSEGELYIRSTNTYISEIVIEEETFKFESGEVMIYSDLKFYNLSSLEY